MRPLQMLLQQETWRCNGVSNLQPQQRNDVASTVLPYALHTSGVPTVKGLKMDVMWPAAQSGEKVPL